MSIILKNLLCVTCITFYRTRTIIFMASLALGVECVSPGRHAFISFFLMTLAAVVGFVIFKVVVAVQTI
jgi:hypothetical protein